MNVASKEGSQLTIQISIAEHSKLRHIPTDSKTIDASVRHSCILTIQIYTLTDELGVVAELLECGDGW